MKRIKNGYLTFCVYAFIGWLYEVFWMWFVVPPKHFVNRGVLIGPFLPIYGFGMLFLNQLLKNMKEKNHKVSNPVYFIISAIGLTTFIYTTIVEYTSQVKYFSVIEYLKDYGLGLLITIGFVSVFFAFIVKTMKEKQIKELDCTVLLVFLSIWIITTVIEYFTHYITETYFHVQLWNYTKDFLNIRSRVNWDASRNFAIGGTFLLYALQPWVNRKLLSMKDKTKGILSLVIGIPMILDLIFHVVLKWI